MPAMADRGKSDKGRKMVASVNSMGLGNESHVAKITILHSQSSLGKGAEKCGGNLREIKV
jgi:hypothetical protein